MIKRSGFTLIEILIVVAIIAILASVVLVGLGPTQQSGRDARRLSDIREVQNGLELFFNKCGFYPGGGAATGPCTAYTAPATWADLQTLLVTTAALGISSIPADPSTNRSYGYAFDAGGANYIVGTALENANNSIFTNYTPPAGSAAFTWATDAASIVPNTDCKTNATYCVTL